MATQPNVVNDLSTLLRIPNRTLAELIAKANLCIGSIIHDSRVAGEEAISINIGLGQLCINLIDMQCKFVPSKDLKATIKNSLLSDSRDPLELALEEALCEKLIARCNEVL